MKILLLLFIAGCATPASKPVPGRAPINYDSLIHSSNHELDSLKAALRQKVRYNDSVLDELIKSVRELEQFKAKLNGE